MHVRIGEKQAKLSYFLLILYCINTFDRSDSSLAAVADRPWTREKRSGEGIYDYKKLYYVQSVDHFNSVVDNANENASANVHANAITNANATFLQKYYVNDKHFNGTGPIFFYFVRPPPAMFLQAPF